MKLLTTALLAMSLLAAVGCSARHGPGAHRWGCGILGNCGACGDGACGDSCGACDGCGHKLLHGCDQCGHCGKHCGHHGRQSTTIGGEPAGPPTGTVAYPYYTTRGPRDFYSANPPSIGP